MISSYQKDCLTRPIPSAFVMGGVFSAFDAAMGQRITPKSVGSYIAFIYTYNAMQCIATKYDARCTQGCSSWLLEVPPDFC